MGKSDGNKKKARMKASEKSRRGFFALVFFFARSDNSSFCAPILLSEYVEQARLRAVLLSDQG